MIPGGACRAGVDSRPLEPEGVDPHLREGMQLLVDPLTATEGLGPMLEGRSSPDNC
jgi:hypothetical protein